MTWLLQRITGAFLFLYMAAHLALTHFGRTSEALERGDAFEIIAQSFRNPFWFWLDMTMLAVVVYHALYGLRAVLLDYVHGASARRTVSYATVVVGVVLFILGYNGLMALGGRS